MTNSILIVFFFSFTFSFSFFISLVYFNEPIICKLEYFIASFSLVNAPFSQNTFRTIQTPTFFIFFSSSRSFFKVNAIQVWSLSFSLIYFTTWTLKIFIFIFFFWLWGWILFFLGSHNFLVPWINLIGCVVLNVKNRGIKFFTSIDFESNGFLKI